MNFHIRYIPPTLVKNNERRPKGAGIWTSASNGDTMAMHRKNPYVARMLTHVLVSYVFATHALVE